MLKPNAGKAQSGPGEYGTRRVPGVCGKKLPCGRTCTLSAEKPHADHICNDPECHICHPPYDAQARFTDGEAAVRARVDRMDVWTLLLALGALAGMWIGGML